MVDIINQGKEVALDFSYSDLDITFTAHPITGDVTLRTDTDAVRRAVRNIVLTNKYERPFKPNFGASLRNALFELDTDRKINRVKRQLVEQIEIFEPRVQDVSVKLFTEGNSLHITVLYTIVNGFRNQELQFTIERVR